MERRRVSGGRDGQKAAAATNALEDSAHYRTAMK